MADQIQNPLADYAIKWIAREGTVHSWPCDEHKEMTIYPPPYTSGICGFTFHKDSAGPIYGCSKPSGHKGPHETLEERHKMQRNLVTVGAESVAQQTSPQAISNDKKLNETRC